MFLTVFLSQGYQGTQMGTQDTAHSYSDAIQLDPTRESCWGMSEE